MRAWRWQRARHCRWRASWATRRSGLPSPRRPRRCAGSGTVSSTDAARSRPREVSAPPLVLHIAESAGWAGGEAYLLKVAARLDRARFRLAVAVPERGPLAPRLEALDVPTFELPLARSLVSSRGFAALVSLLVRVRPAIVQSHGARSNVYVRLAAKLAGVPVALSTVHNSLFDYEVRPWRRRLYVRAEVVTAPLAHRIIAVSRAVARDLVERYGLPPGKVVTIQNGIDADAIAPRRSRADVAAELGVKVDDLLIGVAARMTRQKGYDVLLEAVRLLQPRVPRLRCVLIGDGPLGSELRARATALGVDGACVFTGARADVPDLLAALDVVTLPSRSEGLPFVLLEAMAVGRPVVATAVGGNVEAVEDRVTGLLVPPEDPPALAGALLRLLECPEEAAAMGARGRRRVREHFWLTRMIRALEALYAPR